MGQGDDGNGAEVAFITVLCQQTLFLREYRLAQGVVLATLPGLAGGFHAQVTGDIGADRFLQPLETSQRHGGSPHSWCFRAEQAPHLAHPARMSSECSPWRRRLAPMRG
ncbi:hypothetical protein D9M68_962100 [compost metagenome]